MNFEEEMLAQGVKPIADYTNYHQFVCKKKLQFPTYDAAKRYEFRLGGRFRIYQCPECSGYHLTSRLVPKKD